MFSGVTVDVMMWRQTGYNFPTQKIKAYSSETLTSNNCYNLPKPRTLQSRSSVDFQYHICIV